MKRQIDYIQAHSLRDLLGAINGYNASAECPILKEDIVQLVKEEGTYILLYYK